MDILHSLNGSLFSILTKKNHLTESDLLLECNCLQRAYIFLRIFKGRIRSVISTTTRLSFQILLFTVTILVVKTNL